MANYTGWQSPGYSNDNLLKNWDFRQPVNQRGQSSYTVGARYTIDMWQGNDLCTVDILKNKIRVSTTSQIPIWALSQLIEIIDISQYRGETLTISCSAVAVTGIARLIIFDGYHAQETPITGKGIFCLTYTVPKDAVQIALKIYLHDNNSNVELEAAKLEVGTVSTLALDLMQPPNYPAQLRECQRYLQVLTGSGYSNAVGMAHAYSDTGAYTTIDLEREMRIRPTIIGMENLKIYKAAYAASDSVHVINADYNIAGKNISGNFIYSGSLEAGKEYQVFLDSNSKLLLSSEL